MLKALLWFQRFRSIDGEWTGGFKNDHIFKEGGRVAYSNGLVLKETGIILQEAKRNGLEMATRNTEYNRPSKPSGT